MASCSRRIFFISQTDRRLTSQGLRRCGIGHCCNATRQLILRDVSVYLRQNHRCGGRTKLRVRKILRHRCFLAYGSSFTGHDSVKANCLRVWLLDETCINWKAHNNFCHQLRLTHAKFYQLKESTQTCLRFRLSFG